MTNTPNFEQLSDNDLIGLISYCEKWNPSKVYHTAFKQVFPETQVQDAMMPFDDWVDKGTSLPNIVRNELVRAAEINKEMGRMSNLRAASLGMNLFSNMYFWIFVIIVFWWWF